MDARRRAERGPGTGRLQTIAQGHAAPVFILDVIYTSCTEPDTEEKDKTKERPCKRCSGTGKIPTHVPMGRSSMRIKLTCPRCGGSGKE